MAKKSVGAKRHADLLRRFGEGNVWLRDAFKEQLIAVIQRIPHPETMESLFRDRKRAEDEVERLTKAIAKHRAELTKICPEEDFSPGDLKLWQEIEPKDE